ncbi:MAG: DUF305 domain-containing protein, partial [Gammaproteobacteria bacterium]
MQTAAPLSRRRCMAGAGLLVLSAYLGPAMARAGTVRISRPLLGTQVDIIAQGPLASHAADLAMSEMARLERLRGTEFDRLWLHLMIEHHDGAIRMAED